MYKEQATSSLAVFLIAVVILKKKDSGKHSGATSQFCLRLTIHLVGFGGPFTGIHYF